MSIAKRDGRINTGLVIVLVCGLCSCGVDRVAPLGVPDSLTLSADTSLWIYGREYPDGEYFIPDSILRFSRFRDTNSNSK